MLRLLTSVKAAMEDEDVIKAIAQEEARLKNKGRILVDRPVLNRWSES